jgi:hypothetical protein
MPASGKSFIAAAKCRARTLYDEGHGCNAIARLLGLQPACAEQRRDGGDAVHHVVVGLEQAPDEGLQVGAIFNAAEDWFKPFAVLRASADLRFGEANGVQFDDIDFRRRTLDAHRQVQCKAPHPLEIRSPKCGSGRTVHLANGLLGVLARHIESSPPGPRTAIAASR